MDIDFVLPWVDGSDPAWRAEREKYAPGEGEDGGEARYRDWGTLRYWFRGVAAFAPWVRRVHFVTWGHVPAWLNANEPRLRIVRHQDYIPPKYLPTFSSHAIELNMHRIPELSEHFVYFNDDVYLTAPVREQDFFRNGLACDTCRLTMTHARSVNDVFAHIALNNVGLLNRHLDHAKYMRLNRRRWFSPKNGLRSVARSAMLSFWPYFTGFASPHLAVAYEKRAFEEIWLAEPRELDATCRRRFRSMADVSQLAARSWRLARGHFSPSRPLGMPFFPSGDAGVARAARAIVSQQFRMLCVNDDDAGFDFELERDRLIAAFEQILPAKCSFER